MKFKRTDYTLQGWNTSKDGNGTSYAVNGVFEQLFNVQGINIIDLYAQWKKNETPGTDNGGGTSSGGGGGSISSPQTNSEVILEIIRDSYGYNILKVVPKVSTGNDGKVNINIDKSTADKILKEVESNKVYQILLVPEITNDAFDITFTIPSDVAKAIAKETDAYISVKAGSLEAKIPSTVLADAKKAVELSILKNDDGSYVINKSFEDILNIDIFDKKTNHSTVPVIVGSNGEEEIIKKSIIKDGKIVFILSKDAKIIIRSNGKKYSDIKESNSFKSSIDFVVSRELFGGTEIDKFEPDKSMNRAMLVTVLHRLENMPKVGDLNFDDVPLNEYYSNAVAWSTKEGIIKGKGDGFYPNDNITREELAVILFNYAKKYKIAKTLNMDVENFKDSSDISSWSNEAMQWAIQSGLIGGKGNDILDPKGNATRLEVAIILQRLIEKIVK